MAYEFKKQRFVEFAETDMAGILHFANYFRYMEETEHAFFRSLGLCVHEHSDTGVWGWARGRVDCTFREPLRYEDTVELHLLVRDKRTKTIEYDFVFRKVGPDGVAGVEVARGSMTVICIGKAADGRLQATRMPAAVSELVKVTPTEILDRDLAD